MQAIYILIGSVFQGIQTGFIWLKGALHIIGAVLFSYYDYFILDTIIWILNRCCEAEEITLMLLRNIKWLFKKIIELFLIIFTGRGRPAEIPPFEPLPERRAPDHHNVDEEVEEPAPVLVRDHNRPELEIQVYVNEGFNIDYPPIANRYNPLVVRDENGDIIPRLEEDFRAENLEAPEEGIAENNLPIINIEPAALNDAVIRRYDNEIIGVLFPGLIEIIYFVLDIPVIEAPVIVDLPPIEPNQQIVLFNAQPHEVERGELQVPELVGGVEILVRQEGEILPAAAVVFPDLAPLILDRMPNLERPLVLENAPLSLNIVDQGSVGEGNVYTTQMNPWSDATKRALNTTLRSYDPVKSAQKLNQLPFPLVADPHVILMGFLEAIKARKNLEAEFSNELYNRDGPSTSGRVFEE